MRRLLRRIRLTLLPFGALAITLRLTLTVLPLLFFAAAVDLLFHLADRQPGGFELLHELGPALLQRLSPLLGALRGLPGLFQDPLAFGPGHLSASAMPGQRGNAVIAGHRDTHFNFLQRLAVGEPLAVETVDGESHLYQVIDIDVVDSRRSSLLLDTEEGVLSLVTCYPFDALEPGGPMRYVVTARMLF